MRIIQTQSGNSKWMEKKFQQNIVANNYQLIVADNTNDEFGKVISIYLNNEESDDIVWAWQNIFISPLRRNSGFNFSGSYKIETTFGSIVATNGRKYGISDNSITDIGSSGSGSYFQVANDSATDKYFVVSKNNHIVNSSVLSASDTKNFGYRPTFYVGARIIANIKTPQMFDNTVNTEISVLGITSATVNVAKTNGIYQFSLTNIT